MKGTSSLASEIIVAKVDSEHLLKRPLKSCPIAQNSAGAEANFIEHVLEKLQHLDARNRNDVVGKPALKQPPRQIVLALGNLDSPPPEPLGVGRLTPTGGGGG